MCQFVKWITQQRYVTPKRLELDRPLSLPQVQFVKPFLTHQGLAVHRGQSLCHILK